MKLNTYLFAAMLVGSWLLGCSDDGGQSDACDAAVAKTKACGLPEEVPTGECTGGLKCAADCVNAASCEDLASTDASNPFVKCILGCE